jgi:hypothetical protein
MPTPHIPPVVVIVSAAPSLPNDGAVLLHPASPNSTTPAALPILPIIRMLL